MDGTQGPLMYSQVNASFPWTDSQNVTANVTAATAAPGEASPLAEIAVALPAMLKGFEPLLYNPYVLSSVNWFFFGTILETGRRLWQFLVDKFTAGNEVFQ